MDADPPISDTPIRTQADLAALLGVTRETVSRAFSGHTGVGDAMRTRIFATAAANDYRPNAAARSMVRQRSGQIAVVIRNNRDDRMTHLMAFEAILGINEGLEEDGYVMSLVRIGDLSEAGGSRAFAESMHDGMIVVGEVPPSIEDRIRQLSPATVWLEARTWEPTLCLRRDEFEAGRLCVEAMRGLGYHRLLFIEHLPMWKTSEPAFGYSEEERAAGVREGVHRYGGLLESVPMAYDHPQTWSLAPQVIASLTPDTGVIVTQAYLARWFASAAASLGKTAPLDFGLCCCDDGDDVTRMWPNLCRVKFDRFDMGRRAAAMMLRRLAGTDAEALRSERVPVRWLPGSTATGQPVTR